MHGSDKNVDLDQAEAPSMGDEGTHLCMLLHTCFTKPIRSRSNKKCAGKINDTRGLQRFFCSTSTIKRWSESPLFVLIRPQSVRNLQNRCQRNIRAIKIVDLNFDARLTLWRRILNPDFYTSFLEWKVYFYGFLIDRRMEMKCQVHCRYRESCSLPTTLRQTLRFSKIIIVDVCTSSIKTRGVSRSDVWIFDFSEPKNWLFFRSKKWILFVFKAFEGLK